MNDNIKKTETLLHIQNGIELLSNLKHKTQESLNTWRYLKSARNALAEDIWADARHEV